MKNKTHIIIFWKNPKQKFTKQYNRIEQIISIAKTYEENNFKFKIKLS